MSEPHAAPVGAAHHLDDADVVPGWLPEDVATADAARTAEGADLMAVASHALAAACARVLRARGGVSGRRVVLLVGPGNNGGDALLAGVHLRRRGVGVTALLLADRAHAGGVAALRAAGGRVVAVGDGTPVDAGAAAAEAAAADLVVDGVLGIGATGAVRGAAHDVLSRLGDRAGPVVACDLPSGLDPATGRLQGPVLPADLTVTFGGAKAGLLLPRGRHVVGALQVVDLGLRPHLPAPAVLLLRGGATPAAPAPLVGRAWPRAWRDADKYSRGVLGVAAGDTHYPGAAVLCSRAAAAAGVGMVRYVPATGEGGATEPVGPLVLQAVPEALVQPLPELGRVQAWVVGPGVASPDDRRVGHVLRASDEPAVVDAGALPGLARAVDDGGLRRPPRLLLTPHRGELARLADDLALPGREDLDPVDVARAVAGRTGTTVLLKGGDTVVVAPDGAVVVVPGGPAWLATAGSGDVLAGIAGALLAAGCPPPLAGVLAAHVHAVAAHRAAAGGPLHAGAVADHVQPVLAAALRAAPSPASSSVPSAWDDGARD